MRFIIDFNHFDYPKDQHKILEQLGTFNEAPDSWDDYYTIEINSLEELKALQDRCREITGEKYLSMLLSMDSNDDNSIFFDLKS